MAKRNLDNHMDKSNGVLPVAVRQSGLVEEIISSRPAFLIRWGLTIFFLLLLCVIGLCWWIQYPDVVQARARIVAVNAPKPLIAKQTANLVALPIKENDSVTAGQVLGRLQALVAHDTVLLLRSVLADIHQIIKNGQMEQLPRYFTHPLFTGNNNTLGELQTNMQTFVQALLNFRNYLASGFYARKRMLLLADMNNIRRQRQNIYEQKGLHEKDAELERQNLLAAEQLRNDTVISAFDYRGSQSRMLSKQLALPQLDGIVIGNEGDELAKQKEVLELDNTVAQQKQIFAQALAILIAEVEKWCNMFLLTAPINGRVAFANFIQVNGQVVSGQTVCYINPGNSAYYAEVFVVQANLGKLAIGQSVLLKLPAYPFTEYGAIRGKVVFISHIPTDSGYLARVELTNRLITTYGKQVQYREGLLASAEIIVQEMRLLKRMYYSVVKKT